jgi:hypothetical protein
MEYGKSLKKNGSIWGILSVSISLIVLLLILNWFFEITPFQKLQGIPLMITPFTSTIGIVLSIISFKKSHNIFSIIGLISNAILFVLPFLYWTIGTLVFGP